MEGRVWVVGDAVNTDAMYPGFAMRLPIEEAARYVFHDLRPGWVDEVQEGDLVVAGKNFGIGSSRPVARLFRLLGVQALLAEEFNSLFHRNCINFGLPALTVPNATTRFSDGDIARIDIEVGSVQNLSTGWSHQATPIPSMMREIIDAGGLLPRLAREGFMPR
ncbi:3-isopropylmalate dehydratase (plasmid) [Rhodococcus sp. USK10]|uniref:LeuD/DmdB family oxidoreductase small subunit n=1 Tax=Rhodococcus sp. USK10 TaxID=2789739 RepID=UPI001C5FCE2A|nr:3-isopropylmalate dehydratase [Rhodococcus sp. USK10]QYB00728.1 3-isopropylmalate dehydratase [Rhodococcus sp. USK10]